MESVCRLGGNQENEYELGNTRSAQYAINKTDQEEELNQAKQDEWKMIWPERDIKEKMKHSIDQHKENWVEKSMRGVRNETNTSH